MTQRTTLSDQSTAAKAFHGYAQILNLLPCSGMALRLLLALCALAGLGAVAKAQTVNIPIGDISIDSGISTSVAVDGNETVYAFSGDTGGVDGIYKIPATCGYSSCQTWLDPILGFTGSRTVAVDTHGTLYVTDLNQSTQMITLKRVPPGCMSVSCVSVVPGFQHPLNIAVDGNDNLYAIDNLASGASLEELPAGCASSSCVITLGGGFSNLYGVASDLSGNVYVTETGNTQSAGDVKRVPAGCTSASCVVVLGGDYFSGPYGIGVDGFGRVYVTDTAPDSRLYRTSEVSSDCFDASCVVYFPQNNNMGVAVAVDQSGDNIYVGDAFEAGVQNLQMKPHFRGINVGATIPGVIDLTFPVTGPISNNRASVEGITLTEGAATAEFTVNSPTLDCADYAYNPNSPNPWYCNLELDFYPTLPGLREGAVQVKLTASGTVIGTVPVSGIGVAPQVAFNGNHVHTAVGGGFLSPKSVAIDGSKNLYVADAGHNAVMEVPVGCAAASCEVAVGGGFAAPSGVAINGLGDILVADTGNDAVKEIPVGCKSVTCVVTLPGKFNAPADVAVDPLDDIVVADAGSDSVKEIPVGCSSSTCVVTLAAEFSNPSAVAVDGPGDIFVADTGNNAVKEIPVGCTAASCVITLGGNFSSPAGVALDAAQDVFVADAGNHTMEKMAAGCTSASCVTSVGGGYSSLAGLLFDGTGNLYVAAPGNNSVFKLDFTDAQPLSFDATAVGQTSGDSPKNITISNDGNTPLIFSALSAPANFALDTKSTCTSSTTLNAGGACAVAVDFTPTSVGSFSGNLVLTDNNLNVPAATQTAGLSGQGISPAVTAPAFSQPAGKYTGSVSLMLSDSTSNAVIHYTLDGTTPTASSPVYSQPIEITGYSMVEAVAIVPGGASSPVAGAAYQVTAQTPAPVISLNAETITITDAVAATIRYTTDGSMPTTISKLYSGPIPLSGSETINAIAISTGKAASSISSATYAAQ